jgi:hypothetical protein
MDNLKGTFRVDKNTGDPFSVRVDTQTKDTLKLVFVKLLNHITNKVQAEQIFCQEFFNPQSQHQIVKSDSRQSNNAMKNNELKRTGSSNSLQSSASTNISKQSNDSAKIEL